MLLLRVLSGIVLVPILVGLVLIGEPWYGAAVGIFAILGAAELAVMLRAAGFRPLLPVMLILAAVFPLDAMWNPGAIVPAGLAIAAVATLLWVMARPAAGAGLVDWALTLAPPIYIGGLLQYFIPLRQEPNGPFWVLCVLGLSWSCDTAAYVVGRIAGRTKLAPQLSPTKSVEGALAGVAASVAVGLAVALFGSNPPLHMAGFGLVVGVATVGGDLMESFIKRQCGAKDSGILIPGHGGLLDRMDSLLTAVAAAYGYQVLIRWWQGA